MAKEHEARAAYTDRNRRGYRAAALGGLASTGTAKGSKQAASAARERDRRNLAYKLKPLEKQRQNIDAEIAKVDRAILQLEARLVK